jgi:triosephosphate isomerase
MRRPLIVGNWKMNGSSAENASLLQLVKAQMLNLPAVDIAVCTPFVYIRQAVEILADTDLAVGAQDVSAHVQGAYTGEVSASMLKDIGCRYVIVGHSERRQYHEETNLLVAQKALAAISSNLIPIICVGETLAQREAGEALAVIGEQLQAVLSVLGEKGLSLSVIAYEPVWAIGTGLTASPEQAQEVHSFIRRQATGAADQIQILYGGSVKATNAAELFAQADIDGALIGGASLDANEFIQIAKSVHVGEKHTG